uniref:Peptidase S39 domain-containing protein n=1 Tax=Poinsettia latent virus TaxID=305785 RepID=A0A7G1M1J6_9VIRU|nr:hypothetical protein [Poinsettia latent virus]
MALLGIKLMTLVFAAWLSCCHSSSALPSSGLSGPCLNHSCLLRNSLNGASQWGTILHSPAVGSNCPPCPMMSIMGCSPPKPLQSNSYGVLCSTIASKAKQDLKLCWKEVQTHSEMYSRRISAALIDSLHQAVGMLLMIIIWIWSSIFLVVYHVLAYMITYHLSSAVCVGFLIFCTICAFRLISWICGDLLAFMFTGLTQLVNLVNQLSSRPSWRRYKNEKTVEGYKPFIIPQNPPKKSVIELSFSDGSHLGYATCVRLWDGSIYLMTAKHCLVKEALLKGRVAGHSLPLKNFDLFLTCDEIDFSLLRGPKQWEAYLGVKGADLITSNRIGRSPVTFYNLSKDGEWLANSAQITGRHGKLCSVLSNTSPGDSGTPYYSGKNVVGIHKGTSELENYNLMIPIPNIPGLTSPDFKFETTNVRGNLYNDEDFRLSVGEDDKAEHWTDRLMKSITFKTKRWADWAEEESESDDERGKVVPPAKPSNYGEGCPPEHNQYLSDVGDLLTKVIGPEQNEKCVDILMGIMGVDKNEVAPHKEEKAEKGNEAVVSATVKTVKEPTTQCDEDIISEIVKRVVDKMNLKAIEKSVVEILAEKAMTKAPRRKRKNSKDTSRPSTPGSYIIPAKRTPDSGPVEKSLNSTGRAKEESPSGAKTLPGNIPAWVRKPKVSGGPKQGQRPN